MIRGVVYLLGKGAPKMTIPAKDAAAGFLDCETELDTRLRLAQVVVDARAEGKNRREIDDLLSGIQDELNLIKESQDNSQTLANVARAMAILNQTRKVRNG